MDDRSCPFCTYAGIDARRHYAYHIELAPEYECPCGKKLKDAGSIPRHLQKHTSKQDLENAGQLELVAYARTAKDFVDKLYTEAMSTPYTSVANSPRDIAFRVDPTWQVVTAVEYEITDRSTETQPEQTRSASFSGDSFSSVPSLLNFEFPQLGSGFQPSMGPELCPDSTLDNDPVAYMLPDDSFTIPAMPDPHALTPVSPFAGLLLAASDEKETCIRSTLKGLRCGLFCLNCPDPGLCVRIRIMDHRVFEKWNNKAYLYECHWRHIAALTTKSYGRVWVYHFQNGPQLEVAARVFETTNLEHVLVWGKSKMGWKSVVTFPISVRHCPGLLDYIRKCTRYCVDEYANDLLLLCLSKLSQRSDMMLLPQAMELWTANQLLMKHWQCTRSQQVSDENNPFHGQKPAPRVVQNQLDQHLEAFIAGKEKILLTCIQEPAWYTTGLDIFATTIVFLMVLEQDIWRLLFWIKHESNEYKWRHPTKPAVLVGKSVYITKLLLACIQAHDSVPPELSSIGVGCSSTLRYDETDNRSLDRSLVSYAFKKLDVEDLSIDRIITTML